MANPYAHDPTLLDDLSKTLDELCSASSADRKKIIEAALPKLSIRVKAARKHLVDPTLGRPRRFGGFRVTWHKMGYLPGEPYSKFGLPEEETPEPRTVETYEEVAKLLKLAPATARQRFSMDGGIVKRNVKGWVVTATRLPVNSETK